MNRSARRRLTAILVIGGLLTGVGVIAACSNQGEGEVCQVANGNDDCKTDPPDNLVCYEAKQLNNTISDRCCPQDRSKATHPACVTPIAVVTDDAQAPADTGPSTPILSDAQVSATDAADAADAGDR